MSPASLDLVLRLLEAPRLQFPRSQITGYHGPAGEELIASKWLVPDGFVRAVEAEDDEDGAVLPVAHDDHHRLGFHHRFQGWIGVEQAALQRFRPDLAAIFGKLLGSALTPPLRGIMDLEGGFVWRIGTMRLSRLTLTEVWLTRRLGTPTAVQALRTATARHPPTSTRLVLTTTPHRQVPTETPAMTRIVPVNDVLSDQEAASIDIGMLQARFAGQVAGTITTPLHLSEDGRVLTIGGDTAIIFKGKVQIAMIRALFDAHQAGRRVKAADILTSAQSRSDSLDQAFGHKWKELRPYLKAVDGLWSFDLPAR